VKLVTSLVIIVGLVLGARLVYQYWQTTQPKQPAAASAVAEPVEVPESQLPGLPPVLEAPLEEAREHGAAGLRHFLEANSKAILDPRRAAIELDYVVMITSSNPTEACRIFAKVKGRLDATSPVYARIKKLEKT
jgi:hypothetical protein